MKRIKTILAAVIALTMTVAITAPMAVRADEAPESTSITIFHTNDLHGRFVHGLAGNSHAQTMGLDLIAAVAASVENALLLDAGDTFHGTPFVNLAGGVNAVELMNAAGYDFMAPGNHDFNFGLDQLLVLEGYADFGILAANVFWNEDSSLVFNPYTTVEVAGVTFGLFGLATPTTPIVTHPNNVRDIYFGCTITASELSVSALRELGADIIIAIAHLGYTGPYNTQGLVAAVDGIDLIVDGHSHHDLPEGSWVNDTLIVQAFEHGRRLGRVDITVYEDGTFSMAASLIDLEDTIAYFERDEYVAALIEEMIEGFEEATAEVVAYTPVFLEGDRRYIRTQELPLGNLVADSFQWASGADFAIMNSGAIREPIEAGDITMGNMLAVLPFMNTLVVIEVTPAVLFEAIENGVSLWPVDNGRFPQVSGFSFVFDGYAEAYNRVISITTSDGVALDRNDNTTTFTLAITDFKHEGGDGYSMFVGLPQMYEADMKSTVFINFLTSDDVDIAGASIEGRIMQASPREVQPPVVAEPPPVEEALPPEIPDIPVHIPGQIPMPVAADQPLTYVVQPGETLWTIAYNFYGSMQSDVVYRIIIANRELLAPVSNRVQEGMILTLPAAGRRDPVNRMIDGVLYMVQRGDTLSSIARQFYGDASLWRYIYEANRSHLATPNRIVTGQWLVIPII